MEHTASTTKPVITAGIVAHSLIALGMHIAEHNLPLYTGLRTPDACTDDRDHLTIHLAGEPLLTAWAESIEVDDITVEPRNSDVYPFARHYHGRLPNSGVRVELLELMCSHRSDLAAVPS